MPTKNTQVVSARIPDRIADYFKARAAGEGKTVNRVVGETLIEVVERINNEEGRATNSGPNSANGAK